MNPQVTVTHNITITLPGMEQPVPLSREQAEALRDQLIEAFGRPEPPPRPQEKKPDTDSKRLLEEYRKAVEKGRKMPVIPPPWPDPPHWPKDWNPFKRSPLPPKGPYCKGPITRIPSVPYQWDKNCQMPEPQMTWRKWDEQAIKGVKILDPDGFRNHPDDKLYTRSEFLEMRNRVTVMSLAVSAISLGSNKPTDAQTTQARETR